MKRPAETRTLSTHSCKAVWVASLIILTGGLSGCRANPELLEKLKQIHRAQQNQEQSRSETGRYSAGLDDNARVVYVAMVQDQAQVFSVQPDGKRGVQLTQGAAYKCRPVWSMDHQQLAYFQYPGDRPIGENVSVVVSHADGSGARTVIQDKRVNTQSARISWKPDGSVIYIPERDFPTLLFGYDSRTGEPVETIRLPRNTFMTEVHTLSPNQKMLAGAGPAPGDQTLFHIGTIRRDGTHETDLMKPFVKVPYHVGTVVWSYDSRWVAFELDSILIVMSSTVRLDFKAYPVTPLDFSAQLSGPAFSPSGKLMACITEKKRVGTMGGGDQEVHSDVWVMKIDGTSPKQLTHTGTCFDPHW